MMRRLQRGWEGIKTAAKLHGIKRPRFKGSLHSESGKARYRVLSSGCWEWTGPCNKKGYPIARGKDTTLVYRQIYIDKHGPIPEKWDVDHRCKFRRCVNVEHLEAVTHLVNILRSNRILLSPEKVAFIRSNPDLSTTQLAAQLSVTYNAVYFAKRGDSWKTL